MHIAKAAGFSSVSELLHNKGLENFGIDKIAKPVDSGPRRLLLQTMYVSVFSV